MNRERMLARVRAALGNGNGRDAARSRAAVAARFAHPPQHPRPIFARTEGADRETRLIHCLEAQGTDVIAIDDITALPSAVETLLRRTLSPPPCGERLEVGGTTPAGRPDSPPPRSSPTRGEHVRLVIGDDARLTGLAWLGTVTPELWTPDQTLGDGTAALTHAWAAVAETGTLVLSSNAASPASLAFLPELHIVALARQDIVASFEDAFARLTSENGSRRLPRAVNLVSGASRTGDIGGKIVKGAHGPRRLSVILYGRAD